MVLFLVAAASAETKIRRLVVIECPESLRR